MTVADALQTNDSAFAGASSNALGDQVATTSYQDKKAALRAHEAGKAAQSQKHLVAFQLYDGEAAHGEAAKTSDKTSSKTSVATANHQYEKGKESIIHIKDANGNDRVYGMHVPENYDPSKPTRLVVAAHGASFGKDKANGVLENELDPEGHSKSDKVQDNVVYVYPIAKDRDGAIYGHGTSQDWNTPGKNLLPTQKDVDDLKYVDAVIKDAKKQLNDSHVYTVQAFGFSDGGRLMNESVRAHDGDGTYSYFESDHGTSLHNEQVKHDATATATTIVESAPTVTHTFALDEGDRMFPAQWKPGDPAVGNISKYMVGFAPGLENSDPLAQLQEAKEANQCSEHHSSENVGNTKVTTYDDCKGGTVKLVEEYADKDHKIPAGHAVNDAHIGKGGMYVVGERSDDDEVKDWRQRADEAAQQALDRYSH